MFEVAPIQQVTVPPRSGFLKRIIARCATLSIPPELHCLHVSIPEQRLRHFRNGRFVKAFPVSTGLNPPSCVENSFGTPTGLHRITQKIGDNAPLGMVFKGRLPLGKHFSEMPPEEQAKNLITTRILRMVGLEPGHNQGPGIDTWERFVYIHGTNREELLGQPASRGCVQLSNHAIVQLFNAVPEGTLVLIEA